MKTARVLLLAALLLSAFSNAAFASDETVGFVQLVPQPDPNLPVAIQARLALQRLKPQLLDAQHAGQIIGYDFSPHSGILKIIYRPSAGLPRLAGMKVEMQAQQAAPAVPPADIPVCTVPRFRLYLYDDFFTGDCLTPDATVLGSLRDPAGRVVATYSGLVSPIGTLPNQLFASGSPYADVLPGYTVTFKEYVGGALAATFRIKAPNITFTSLNRSTSVVQGTGSAGKAVTLTWIHQTWGAVPGVVSAVKDRTVSSTGTWRVDFGTIPIRGGDHLAAAVYSSANFIFAADMYVPYIYCTLGGNFCELMGFAFTPATLQILHGGQTYTYSGSFDSSGSFDVEVKTPSGAPVFLVPFDKVSGTGVAQYGLPKLTANLDYAGNNITGKAPAYKYFQVRLYEVKTDAWRVHYTHSNGTGAYTADLGTHYGTDLLPGNPYLVGMLFVLPSTGNTTDMIKAYGP